MKVVEMKAQEGPCVGSSNAVLLSRRSSRIDGKARRIGRERMVALKTL